MRIGAILFLTVDITLLMIWKIRGNNAAKAMKKNLFCQYYKKIITTTKTKDCSSQKEQKFKE